MEGNRTKILICIPLYGGVSSEWLSSFVKLLFALQRDPSLRVEVAMSDAQPLAVARNELLLMAKKYSEEYGFSADCLFFLDSDNIISEQGFRQLLSDAQGEGLPMGLAGGAKADSAASHRAQGQPVQGGCDIVSALYFMRKAPHRPVVLKSAEAGQMKKWADYKENSLSEAEGIGMGCCLMKRKVADALLQAHEMPFEYLKVQGREGRQIYLTEDIVFCDRARGLGFRIFLDSRVVSGHVGGIVEGSRP